MTPRVAPSVLIVSEDQSKADCWRLWLSGIVDRVWIDPAAVSADDRIDILIFHGPHSHRRFQVARPHHRASDFATASIAADAPADVELDADVPESELRLACTLLAEIAYLRRAREGESQLRQRLTQIAFIDHLTGVSNRRAWEEELLIRASYCQHETLCLALVDLDQFKRVNDDHGHVAGDSVLKAIADGFRQQVRSRDFVARLGGDEFGLLFSPIDPARAHDVVDRVCKGACDHVSRELDRRIKVSAGMSVWTLEQESAAARDIADWLYAAADQALVLAKQSGSSQVCESPPERGTTSRPAGASTK